MSKNITIQEAGLPQYLTVDALRLKKQGSGSEDWLPADGKNLVELDIGGSGTYRASDYNAYGIAIARVAPKYGGGATSKAAQQPGFGNLHIPVIQEGGLPVLMSARMIKTNLQGGGTCLWVPEDEVNLDAKYVDHSGTYTARADNCYGYSQITVSGVDVEIKQDEDGDDVAETTDGGTKTIQKLPYRIAIETPPRMTVYYDQQTIDTEGMVVKAFLKNGAVWEAEGYSGGIIPLHEIVIDPLKADKANAEYSPDAVMPVVMDYPATAWGYNFYIDPYTVIGVNHNGNNYLGVGRSDDLKGKYYLSRYGDDVYITRGDRTLPTTHYRIFAEKNNYSISLNETIDNWRIIRYSDDFSAVPISSVPPTNLEPIFQSIKVSWNRIVDGKTLETQFTITVHE